MQMAPGISIIQMVPMKSNGLMAPLKKVMVTATMKFNGLMAQLNIIMLTVHMKFIGPMAQLNMVTLMAQLNMIMRMVPMKFIGLMVPMNQLMHQAMELIMMQKLIQRTQPQMTVKHGQKMIQVTTEKTMAYTVEINSLLMFNNLNKKYLCF